MNESHFLPKSYTQPTKAGQVTRQAPSNIALVKYWGKYGEQLPQNTSISFTLSACHTKTSLHYEPKQSSGFDFDVYFDGCRETSFEPKISAFFERVLRYIPFLEQYRFRIETANTFPHSSGIASSASGMAALSLCLVAVEQSLATEKYTPEYETQKASFLARLGSGSACRSVYDPVVVWGRHAQLPGSSQLYGSSFPFEIHSVFENYQDCILLVDQGEKQVSSTVGHGLMHGHPFAESRFEQAMTHTERLSEILQSGDLDAFIHLVENEALSLHAMMLASTPSFILMKPNTLEIINRLWDYRKKTQSKACFTLDAGANVHLLYPQSEKETVQTFIKKELKPLCQNGHYIDDVVRNVEGESLRVS